MTTATVSSTGSALGDLEQLTAYEPATVERHTRLGLVGNPALRDALGQFDTALTGLTAPLTALMLLDASRVADVVVDRTGATFELVSQLIWADPAPSRPAVGGYDDAVHVIDDLARRLGVPVRDLVTAAGVSRSTFYSWKTPDAPRPRVGSQGRLWALAQTVEDLEELVPGPLRAWFLTDARRRSLLVAGKFDELLTFAAGQRRSPEPSEYVAAYAVGGDRDARPEPEPMAPRRRKVTAAPVRRAADRRRG